MLGKRLIKTSAGAACTTDTVQILDGVPFQSIATYELDGDATNLVETGYINKAGVFNGSSSRINLPSNPINGLSSVSFSFWIKPNDIASYQYVLSFINSVDGWNGVGVRISNTGKINVVRANSGTVTAAENSTTTLSLNVWQHVAVSVQQSGTVIYINGSPDGTFSSTPFTTNNTGSFDIGMNEYASGVTQAFTNGSIDQVRIFNRVITANEVTTLYGETSASSTKSTTDIFADSSALALYEFEGNANDTGGTYNGTATNVVYNEYDGTASNVTYSTGKFGQAAVFNGSSSYISRNSAFLPTGNASRTFSFWTKLDTHVNDAYFMSYGDGVTGQFFSPRVTPVSQGGYISFMGYAADLNSNVVMTTGEWMHLCYTYNGTTLKIYKNAVEIASGNLSLNTSQTRDFIIGARDYNGSITKHIDGSIDQIRIYDKAISAADVTTLYNETVATASTNITFNSPSLVAYYKMNDATDETGSYDGTPTNVNFNVAGKFGNAGDFNGSSSRIETSEIVGLSDVSVSCWLRSTNTSSSERRGIIELNGDTSAGWAGTLSILYRYSDGAILVRSGNASSSEVDILTHTDISLRDGDWHNLIVTRNESTGVTTLYIDGSQADQETVSSTSTVGGGTLIGDRYTPSAGNYNWNGQIDQVRIFDKAITADEVTKLYNEVYCQPTIVPTDHFEPVIYTGNGSSQSISTLDFQPDLVWWKNRDIAAWHQLHDSIRGAGNRLFSNDISSTQYDAQSITSFDANGFTIGTSSDFNGKCVSWNWRAGGAAVTNTDGTITSQVSANVDAGFSIVDWTTTSSTNQRAGHGLSATPEIIIHKQKGNTSNWFVFTTVIDSSYDYLLLNTTAAKSDIGSSDLPTSTTFSTQNFSSNWISYCFHSVDGMSKIGSYVGNFSFDGPTIVTGFRPAFLMIKRTDIAGNWFIFDNKRSTDNERDDFLHPNSSAAETLNNANYSVDFLSNGFQIKGNGDQINGNNGTHIYMAFAEENVEPQPVLANSFNTVLFTGDNTSSKFIDVGFTPDLVWLKSRDTATSNALYDTVRGNNLRLVSNGTGAEDSVPNELVTGGFNIIGSTGYNDSSLGNQVAWCWKASNESTINQDGSITSIVSANPAAGFSVVKYSGAGTTASVGHGLSSAPDLVIIKNTNNLGNWGVYTSIGGAQRKLLLNSTIAEHTSSTWLNTPTSTVLNIQNDGDSGVSGRDYIAYCFHSVAGYQSVGSYTGTGALGNVINVGFKPSFILLKNTSSGTNGDGWFIFDTTRSGSDIINVNLQAQSADAESGPYAYTITVSNTGFEPTGSFANYTGTNALGNTYIYLAIKAN